MTLVDKLFWAALIVIAAALVGWCAVDLWERPAGATEEPCAEQAHEITRLRVENQAIRIMCGARCRPGRLR